jgi:predicted acyl esterase
VWLDRYVAGDPKAKPEAEPAAEIGEGDGRWRHEAQWPPADVVTHGLAVNAGSFTDSANQGSFGAGSDTWSISAPLAAEARIAGTPKLTVDASSSSPRAHLIAQIFDIDEKGSAALMHRAAHVIKPAQPAAGKLTFDLYPNDWTVRAGHRIGLRLTADDMSWYLPPHSNLDVEVAGGTLELPFLAYRRGDFMGQVETPSIKSRRKLTLPAEEIAAATAAFEQPKRLTDPPRGSEQGAAPAPPSAQKPANGLTVSRRFYKGKRVRVIVKGAGASRVQITVKRGKKAVAKRTVRAKGGAAKVVFKLKKKGTYRFSARTLDGVSLRGASKKLRVR